MNQAIKNNDPSETSSASMSGPSLKIRKRYLYIVTNLFLLASILIGGVLAANADRWQHLYVSGDSVIDVILRYTSIPFDSYFVRTETYYSDLLLCSSAVLMIFQLSSLPLAFWARQKPARNDLDQQKRFQDYRTTKWKKAFVVVIAIIALRYYSLSASLKSLHPGFWPISFMFMSVAAVLTTVTFIWHFFFIDDGPQRKDQKN